jgi:type II secretory pathway component GspD/PulD (secretin)
MSFLRQVSYIRDFDVEIAQASTAANPVVAVVNDGVALDVRPVVDADLKFITMELRPTVMQLQLPLPTFTTTLGVGQPISIQLPNVNLQRVRTTVTMPDGGSMMLGGMRLLERIDRQSGVPILSSIPILSFFFSRQEHVIQHRKILILIRAKIILSEEYEPLLAPARPRGAPLAGR